MDNFANLPGFILLFRRSHKYNDIYTEKMKNVRNTDFEMKFYGNW